MEEEYTLLDYCENCWEDIPDEEDAYYVEDSDGNSLTLCYDCYERWDEESED